MQGKTILAFRRIVLNQWCIVVTRRKEGCMTPPAGVVFLSMADHYIKQRTDELFDMSA